MRHSDSLVSISKTRTETVVNMTGVVHSISNNRYGIIEFQNADVTERAFFLSTSVFVDRKSTENDQLNNTMIQFDG